MKIYISRVDDHPFPDPQRGSEGAAGLDLITTRDLLIRPHDQVLAPTGFAWEIPEGHVGLIRPRSGLSARHHLDVGAGVIDSDYRGEVQVLLRNLGSRVVRLRAGDRVAQMLVMPVLMAECAEVAYLDETERGDGGFGSTGVSVDHA